MFLFLKKIGHIHTKELQLTLTSINKLFKFGSVMLSDYQNCQKNNFTILRFVLAIAVLIGHSFPITGNGSDPLSQIMLPHEWIGSLAVNVFFCISGYLVTASLSKRGPINFLIARFIRLYPAVIVYSLITIFFIGPLGTDLSLPIYFQSTPWNYLNNITLWEWTYNLPHVFQTNPLAGSTNGSTWTLPVELRCYLTIFVLGFFGIFDSRLRANVALSGLLILVFFKYPAVPLFDGHLNFSTPLTYFLLGSLAWINRMNIPIDWRYTLFAFFTIFFTCHIGYSHYVLPFLITYIFLSAVYLTPFLNVDSYGDISYGIYIYAWPIQQLVWTPGQSGYTNAFISSIIVIPIAFLSWRYVEKPALAIRKIILHP